MANKKLIIVTIGALCISTGFVFNHFYSEAPASENDSNATAITLKQEKEVEQQLVKVHSQNAVVVSSSQNLEEMAAEISSNHESDTSDTEDNPQQPVDYKPLFVQSERAKRVLEASGKLRQDLNNEAYLELDNQRLSSLKEGDVLPLQIAELDLDYEIKIKQVKEDAQGNKTITGQLPDQDFPFSSVISINDHALYANIVTPTGTYSMAGDGHNVWIAETGDLIQGVIPDKYDSHDFTEGEPHEHHDLETSRLRKNGN